MGLHCLRERWTSREMILDTLTMVYVPASADRLLFSPVGPALVWHYRSNAGLHVTAEALQS